MSTQKRVLLATAMAAVMIFSGSNYPDSTGNDFLIRIIPGPEWIHAFSLFIKNPPQYALWLEDETGRYMGTIYVTGKIARGGWIANKGNRRIEALPVWMHKRNVRVPDGLLQPDKDNPVTDGLSGATPREGQELRFAPRQGLTRFWLYLEINHSTDFNDTWPKDARKGERGWSGGKEGSGQPSLVYRVFIDGGESGPWTMELVGSGSSDGSDGTIETRLTGITTAYNIIEIPSVVRTHQ
jgi:hypothetical protein